MSKKTKPKSDQAIINTWVEAMRYFQDGDKFSDIFKTTGRANVFEVNMGGVIFTATFERKTEVK